MVLCWVLVHGARTDAQARSRPHPAVFCVFSMAKKKITYDYMKLPES